MNKKSFLITLIIICIVSTLTFVGTVFAQAGYERDCYFIVAGKKATADGSVLMAYNNDYNGNNALHVEVVPRKKHNPGETYTLMSGKTIPQPSETYAYKRLINHWDQLEGKNNFKEGGINEYQVGVLFGTWARSYNTGVSEADPPIEEGFGDEIWYLILERSKTAREGVELFKSLADSYGIGEWAIGTFAIGDPNEVWVIEMAGGKHWVAQRVPDNTYYVEANALQLRNINLNDNKNFIGPKDLVSFSEEIGIYDPEKDGDFDFAKAYGGMEVMDPYNRLRIWRAQSLLTSSAQIKPDDPYEKCKIFLTPDTKIKPQDIMSIMRNHYEGTQYDTTEGYKLGTPHLYGKERTICVGSTNYSAVWQLRNWMPNDIGGIMWVAMASPCTSVYVPFYVGITDTPESYKKGNGFYDRESAFWVYREIGNLVGGYYSKLINDVQTIWQEFENREFAIQSGVEKVALEIYKQNPALAKDFLTTYSFAQANAAYNIGKRLQGDFHKRITNMVKAW